MVKDQSAEGTTPDTARSDAKPVDAGNVERELRAMVLIGRRNIDAAWSINRLAMDCIDRCAERQSELWSRFSTSALGMLDLFGMRTQDDLSMMRGSPVISETVDLVLAHMREMSETVARANQEALDVVRVRSEACFKEVEEITKRNIATLMESEAPSATSLARDVAARGKRPESSEGS
jgi:hypothetical protein